MADAVLVVSGPAARAAGFLADLTEAADRRVVSVWADNQSGHRIVLDGGAEFVLWFVAVTLEDAEGIITSDHELDDPAEYVMWQEPVGDVVASIAVSEDGVLLEFAGGLRIRGRFFSSRTGLPSDWQYTFDGRTWNVTVHGVDLVAGDQSTGEVTV